MNFFKVQKKINDNLDLQEAVEDQIEKDDKDEEGVDNLNTIIE
jgi:hypothetical protein